MLCCLHQECYNPNHDSVTPQWPWICYLYLLECLCSNPQKEKKPCLQMALLSTDSVKIVTNWMPGTQWSLANSRGLLRLFNFWASSEMCLQLTSLSSKCPSHVEVSHFAHLTNEGTILCLSCCLPSCRVTWGPGFWSYPSVSWAQFLVYAGM